ncbi:MAG TPA: ABC transporter permease [Candidatus Paceibacterota bacterium]|nr:ABC transporter permease [Candidatus Paceibacterota bacterium]
MWNIVHFEVFRALKKRSFWFAAIAPPLLILAVIGVENLSSKSAANTAAQQARSFSQTAKIAVLDDSGLISKQLLSAQHIATEPNENAGIDSVKGGSLDAFFYYPADVASSGIEIYAQDQGNALIQPYNDVATAILTQSAIADVSSSTGNPEVVDVLQKTPAVTAITYKNGVETQDIESMIAPGIFAGLFLVLVILLAYIMISSTAEEKANRTAEILLTSIKTRLLITGKIVSIFILGIVQIIVIGAVLLVAHALLPGQLQFLNNISLSNIPIDPVAVTFAILFFVAGFLMFTGILVGLGALFPSTNEAGRFIGLSIIWNYIPIYAISTIISSPHALAVTVFTYFPLTAPTTALLRNTLGSLSLGESFGALAVIVASAVLAVWFAVRAFRYGSMEYGRRVGIKELLRQ